MFLVNISYFLQLRKKNRGYISRRKRSSNLLLEFHVYFPKKKEN